MLIIERIISISLAKLQYFLGEDLCVFLKNLLCSLQYSNTSTTIKRKNWKFYTYLPVDCYTCLNRYKLKKQQNCQRDALNALFMVADPYSRNYFILKSCYHCVSTEFYLSETIIEKCSEGCMQALSCLCSSCKCCDACSLKCTCPFATSDPDTALAKLLLGEETPEYL